MMIAAVVLGLIAIWYFFLRKKKSESGFTRSKTLEPFQEYGYAASCSDSNPCPDGKHCWRGKCVPNTGRTVSAREESAFGIQECKMLGPGVVASSNEFPCHLPGKKKIVWQSTY